MTVQATLQAIDAKIDKRKPKFKQLDYVMASDLTGDEAEFADELIEGIAGRMAMIVLYGDSNCGKTFLAVDIGCAIARGIEWMGRKTECGLVVYLGTESPSSVRNRVRGYQKFHGITVSNFVIVSSPINLFGGTIDTSAVINLIQTLEEQTGAKCELVIGDTLARMSAGANENSGEDMTTVLAHLDLIKDRAATSVLLIHHTGKDAAKGMRGWSGLRAAVDTELEVTVNETTGIRALEITKQRDMPGKGDRIGFRLDSVPMGISKWGKEQSSCVVISADAPCKPIKAPKLGETQQAVVALLRGAGRNMRIKEIAEELEKQGLSGGSVRNAINRLRDVELVEISMGTVHLNGGKS